MINETLKERLPALPRGWRWRLDRPDNIIYKEMYRLTLQRGVFGVWFNRADEYCYPDRPKDWSSSIDYKAEKMYNRFINKTVEVDTSPNHPLLGVTDE